LNVIFQLNKKTTHFWAYLYMNFFVFMWKTLWSLSKHFRYTLCMYLYTFIF